MSLALLQPSEVEPGAAIDDALAEMAARTERRQRVDSHLAICQECTDVLCGTGAQLVREALA